MRIFRMNERPRLAKGRSAYAGYWTCKSTSACGTGESPAIAYRVWKDEMITVRHPVLGWMWLGVRVLPALCLVVAPLVGFAKIVWRVLQ